MVTINVRENEEEVTEIMFGSDGEVIKECQFTNYIKICDDISEIEIEIHKSDIDYLIKALRKAKELWC